MTIRHELNEIAHYRNAYLLALSAAMGSIFYGWDMLSLRLILIHFGLTPMKSGLIGGIITLPSFQVSFGVDKLNASAKANFNGNIVSILQGGCFFGALAMGYFSGRFGRKACLLASGVIYIVGSVIQSIAGLGSSKSTALSVLYFSRFLGGIGVGMVSALVPSYVSECAPRKIRGRCTGMIQFANNIGIMLSSGYVNYSVAKNMASTDMQWRIPFIVQVVPGALFLAAMLFQPESPRWLVEKGRHDQAARTLSYVARTSVDDPAVLVTLEEIKDEFDGKHRLSLWQQLKGMGASAAIANRSLIPSLVMFFQQWTGTNAINYFSPQIFAGLGITGTSSTLFATGIYGVVKVVSVGLVLMFAVESFGRKRCLMVGGIGQGLMMLWIGGYSAVHPSSRIVPARVILCRVDPILNLEMLSQASYVSLVAVYLYAVFYCVGWGPVPWVVAGEVAPNHLRNVSLAIAVGVNWLFSFTISKITPIMLNNIKYGTFLIFGLMCMVMAVWTYVFYPETSGYALEDIHYLFENDVVIRALQDAPLGRVFIGKRRAISVDELRKRETNGDRGSIKDGDTEASDNDHDHLMGSYLRSWIPALPTAVRSHTAADNDNVPDNITISPPLPEDEGSDTEKEMDDSPPAFPSLNSAQRMEMASSIPKILMDSETMPPPPPPNLMNRTLGVPSVSRAGAGGLAVPPTTTKRPVQTNKKREKVALAPGHSPLDWAVLKSSGKDLRGVETLMRIPPSVLRQHNTREDAWSAFNGKVYNLTAYLPFHPGGEKELMRVAGRDGTKLFGLTHAWVNVDFMLDSCLVGFLVPELSTS
ncbi:hypothetical protein D9757_002517 [Collybiopsis confluens]|uniref:Major facilitator superfamily (MFS) profile domain-containing protein n=1 Tax=Collybiopsis confluens TaxID=2823264 RepID=A0A8H5MF11_9AGAR|nr:hypothetical protein D9757_002517 [Collybiopsis confluens]